jgi:hypothetical protein
LLKRFIAAGYRPVYFTLVFDEAAKFTICQIQNYNTGFDKLVDVMVELLALSVCPANVKTTGAL